MDIRTLARRHGVLALSILYGVVISLVHFYVVDPPTRHSGSLLDLYFGFGETLKTMRATGSYLTCMPHDYYANYGNYCYVAARVPVMPLLLYAMSLLSLSTLPALLVKNVLGAAVIGVAIMRHSGAQALLRGEGWAELKKPRTLLLLLFVFAAFLVPLNAFIITSLDYEEGYLIPALLLALAVLFDLEARREFVLLGLLLAFLLYTKASMWPAALVLAVLAIVYAGKGVPLARRAAPLLILVVAYLGWGGFVYAKTGHFAAGTTISSWAGAQLVRGNNDYVDKLYPDYSIDYPFEKGLIKPDRRFDNEWQENAYFQQMGQNWIAAHPAQFVKLALRKTGVILFGIRDNGRKEYDAHVGLSPFMLLDRLMFFAALLACAYYAWRRQALWKPLVAGALAAGAYCAPLVVGYAYNRHILPFILVVLFTAAWVPREGPPKTAA